MADLEHLHPELRRRLDLALADHPGAYVLSGARSNSRQAELAWCYQQRLATGRCPGSCGECNPANAAGTSWHEYDESAPWPDVDAERSNLKGGPWALAVDLAGDYAGIIANADAYGLCFPIDGEAWHAQPAEVTEPRRTLGAWRRLQLPAPPPDPWAELFVPVLVT